MQENLSSDECKRLTVRCKAWYGFRNNKRIRWSAKSRKLELYTKAGNLQKYLGKATRCIWKRYKKSRNVNQM